MKTIFITLAAFLITFNGKASDMQICVSIADQACKELEGLEYVKCHSFNLDLCLRPEFEFVSTNAMYCEERCLNLSEPTMREICLSECGSKDKI